MPQRPRMQRIVRNDNGHPATGRAAMCLLLLAIATTGCRDVAIALGRGPAEARVNSDAFFAGLRARFGPVESAPGFDELRAKIARSALVPSRLYEDDAMWTASGPDFRDLAWGGRLDGGRYVLGFTNNVRAPVNVGDYRRSTRLQSLGESDYQWTVRDELAVGSVTPAELAAALGVLMRGAERGNAAALRAEYRRSLPRTTEALGRLFSLDSLALTPAREGGTLVSIVTTGHPDRIVREFPLLSRFLQRYMTPARVELIASDAAGGRWWVVTMNRYRITIRLRIHNGRLAPLEGASRTIPDWLRLDARMSTRVRLFGVGFSELVGDLQLRRDSEVKGVTMRFRREPEWNLPPLVERLVRAPLRRPFDGDGASLAMAVRGSGGRTLLVRDYQIAVRESAIVRWIGDLGSTAAGDFRSGAERESDRFNGELFGAFGEDMRQLLR